MNPDNRHFCIFFLLMDIVCAYCKNAKSTEKCSRNQHVLIFFFFKISFDLWTGTALMKTCFSAVGCNTVFLPK